MLKKLFINVEILILGTIDFFRVLLVYVEQLPQKNRLSLHFASPAHRFIGDP